MRFLLCALLAMIWVGPAAAQQPQLPPDNCHTTLKTGSGPTFTKVCISSTGNVTMFESPAGVEHIRVGDTVEGYRVCRSDMNGEPAWDSGARQSASWTAPTIYQPNGPNTLPLRITRDTDGLRIVQEFFFGAQPYGPAELTIQMKVYNRTAAPVFVRLQRFFDGDINGTPNDDQAIATGDSVGVVNIGNNRDEPIDNRGVLLSAGILDKLHFTGWNVYANLASAFEGGDLQCLPEFTGITTPRDDVVGSVSYAVGSVPIGGVRTVSFLYRRF